MRAVRGALSGLPCVHEVLRGLFGRADVKCYGLHLRDLLGVSFDLATERKLHSELRARIPAQAL